MARILPATGAANRTAEEQASQPATSSLRDDFSALYLRWKTPLQRLIRGRFGKSAEDAEDATQEILLRVHSQRQSQTGWQVHEEDEARYLHTAARNQVTDAWRRDGRGAGPELESLSDIEAESAALMTDSANSPETLAAQRQLIERISAAVDELPERQRRAFLLNRIDGHSFEEVAQLMEISPRMVAKHISRALAYCELRSQYASREQMLQACADDVSEAALLMQHEDERSAP